MIKGIALERILVDEDYSDGSGSGMAVVTNRKKELSEKERISCPSSET